MNKVNEILSISIFPFKDLTFFNKDYIIDYVSKSKSLAGKKKSDRLVVLKKLKDEINDLVVAKISSQFKIRNEDEVKLTLNKYYNLEEFKSIRDVYNRYLNIIEEFSTCFISTRDGKIVYKYWRNERDADFLGPYEDLKKVEIFHNLSKMTSMDLFAVMFFVKNNRKIQEMHGFYSIISLEDMQLDDVLVKGIAENHIHAGAAFNFNLFWQEMMNKYNHNDIAKMKSSYNSEMEFKKYKERFIKLAAVIRFLLCVFLKYRSSDESINKFLRDRAENREINSFFQDLEEGIDKVETYRFNDALENIKKIYIIDSSESEKDFIFIVFHECRGIKTYGENIFLYKCLEYMKNGEDLSFMHYFFQYIRIKNEFYMQIVENKQVDGLDRFQSFYHRSSKFFKGKEYYKLMLRTLFQNEYLRKVELRFSTCSREEDLKSGMRDILSAYKEIIDEDYKNESDFNNMPRLGVVFHFLKRKESEENEKCWMEYDEEKESTYNKLTYKELQEQYKREVRCLKKVRSEVPYLSYFILGIDAASNENNTPVKVFAPIYEEARDSSNDSLISIDEDGNIVKNKSLSFTFHAGEDFRHVVSGLRRIDEVVKYCKFHSGDRIGHGTALGIDMKKWKDNNPIILIPRGEYLDNLLWTWGVFTKVNTNNSKINIFLENEIYNVSKEIFYNKVNGITTAMLYDAYKERFKEFLVKDSMRFNMKGNMKNDIVCLKTPEKNAVMWDAEKINYAYHCKCYLKKINEPIFVSVKDIDMEMAKQLQNYVINNLAKKGIIVEVNPSSNAVIGEISDMFNNQIYSINKLEDKEYNNVLVSINSDDPMIFNTNTSNEIAYMYYGLLDKNVGKERALDWIEKIRKCGMETSFVDNKLSDSKYYAYLCRVLDKLS